MAYIPTQLQMQGVNNFSDITNSASGRFNLDVFDKSDVVTRSSLGDGGGLIFEGPNPNGRMTVYSSGQNLGSGDMGGLVRVLIPTGNLSSTMGIFNLTPNASIISGESFCSAIESNGNLTFNIHGNLPSDFRQAVITGVVSRFAGKLINLAWSRSRLNNDLTVWINSRATGYGQTTFGNAPQWNGNVNNTYFHLGIRSGTAEAYKGNVDFAALFNCTLSQNDINEIAQTTDIPFRFKWGSQQITYQSNFSAGVDQWSDTAGTVTGNQDGILGFDDNLLFWADNTFSATHRTRRSGGNFGWTDNKRVKLSFDYFIPSDNTNLRQITVRDFEAFTIGAQTGSVTGLWSPFPEVDWVYRDTVPGQIGVEIRTLAANGGGYTGIGASGDDRVYLRNFQARQIGCIALYRCNDGLGYQIKDQSPNKLHGTLITGITHKTELREGFLRCLTSTSGDERLLGQESLPSDIRIKSYTMRSQVGTPTVKIGTSVGGGEIITGVTLSTAYKEDFTFVTRIPNTTPTGGSSIWVNSNSGVPIEHSISYERINF